jgi:hypothetical protein
MVSKMAIKLTGQQKLQISDGVLQNGFENVYNFVREQLIYEHNQQNAHHDRHFGRYSTSMPLNNLFATF